MSKTFSIDRKALLADFLEFVAVDTSSSEASSSTPSTERQFVLARLLKAKLEALGLSAVELTDKGCVLAKLPGNSGSSLPRVAFLAHIDTSDSCPGKASPAVWQSYDGQVIRFPRNHALSLSPESCPELAACLGHDIVTASGDSLLGGDDKAGVAVILAGLRALLADPSLKHGPLSVCFNPDEEIGRGADAIPIAKLDADFAFTFDSDGAGVYNFETFSADRAELTVVGVSTHPGSAKGKMVNALKLISKFVAALPSSASPERTSGRRGFIHPVGMTGSASDAKAEFILRDFEEAGLAKWRALLEGLVAKLKASEPRASFKLEFFKQYRNMRDRLAEDMRPVDCIRKAIRRAGLKPRSEAVRGGTDGSRLTEAGLPTPNIFAGYRNPHSLLEWASVQDMESAAKVMVELALMQAKAERS